MHFTGTKSSPYILLLLLKYKKCSTHIEAFQLMQCIIMEKHSNHINKPWWNKEKGSWLTDSQSKKNLKLRHG